MHIPHAAVGIPPSASGYAGVSEGQMSSGLASSLESLSLKGPSEDSPLLALSFETKRLIVEKLNDGKSLGNLRLAGNRELKHIINRQVTELTLLADMLGEGEIQRLIRKFPELTRLRLLGSPSAQQMSSLVFARKLTHLDLSLCQIEQLSYPLPYHLKTLDLSYASVRSLPESLPLTLCELNLTGCDTLLALPSYLPPALETLNLTGCRALTALPERFPEGLQKLVIAACPYFREAAPRVPDGCEVVRQVERPPREALPGSI